MPTFEFFVLLHEEFPLDLHLSVERFLSRSSQYFLFLFWEIGYLIEKLMIDRLLRPLKFYPTNVERSLFHLQLLRRLFHSLDYPWFRLVSNFFVSFVGNYGVVWRGRSNLEIGQLFFDWGDSHGLYAFLPCKMKNLLSLCSKDCLS